MVKDILFRAYNQAISLFGWNICRLEGNGESLLQLQDRTDLLPDNWGGSLASR